jgi:hypothetical protein
MRNRFIGITLGSIKKRSREACFVDRFTITKLIFYLINRTDGAVLD